MSEKRRDDKNRILRNGESQRKDGAFQLAVDDDLIRKNPFEFQLATVVVNNSVTREAITRKQERQFLDFIQSDRHFSKYYEGIFILFKTGLRIKNL